MPTETTHIIIAISKHGWGKGATPLDAAKKCRKQSPYGKQTGKITFYECHPETTVNGLGDFIYPTGQAPQKIIA